MNRAKKKILLVEDEEILRFTFRALLEGGGYEVRAAEGFAAALESLESFSPDIIFSDIILGGRTGIDLLREVARISPGLPFIIITGKPSIDSAAEALRHGAFDYLVKPVTKQTLLKIAEHALRHSELIESKNRAELERETIRQDLEAIFSSVDDGIITVDSRLAITRANAAAQKLAGGGLTAGQPLDSLRGIFSTAAKLAKRAIEEGRPCREPAAEARSSRSDSKRVFAINSSPLTSAAGAPQGAVIVLADITRETSLERELAIKNSFHGIIGANPRMKQIFSLIETLAQVDVTVLIEGESGTGKELAAEALHRGGQRAAGPLVKVNCSALPETLLESELFGHIRGAFTGATQDRTGRFQLAHGGTIFLDEIGDLSPLVQLKLLRVLQEKQFERVGGSKPVKVDARIVAGSNKDLRELVRDGAFREDLFYRLNVVRIAIPPLRERRDDIPLLIEHFMSLLNARFGKNIRAFSADAMRALLNHNWPGNVRELEHAMEHAFILCRGDIATSEHLPPEISRPGAAARSFAPAGFAEETASPASIAAAIEKAGGNKTKAARLLGISRRTLYRKLGEPAPPDSAGQPDR